jgi:hypothetical protein
MARSANVAQIRAKPRAPMREFHFAFGAVLWIPSAASDQTRADSVPRIGKRRRRE